MPIDSLARAANLGTSLGEILLGLFALSIGAGFVGALSGLGGGVFIVPALVVLAKMPMKVAVGASLISVVATSAGASVAFVRDGWTNLKVAMVLECATVTGALTGAYLAGVVPTWILELLFALMMLQSAYFSLRKQEDDLIEHGDPIAKRLHLMGEVQDETGKLTHYEVDSFSRRCGADGGRGHHVGAARHRVGRAQGDGDGLLHAPAAEGFERDQQLHDRGDGRRGRAGILIAWRCCDGGRGAGRAGRNRRRARGQQAASAC